MNIEMPPHHSPKFQGWFFYALKHYLINVKTNVSNARMNIPKAIRSLKSNGFLSISTIPILCRIEVSHPATRLFLSIYYHKRGQHTISISVSPVPPTDRRTCRSKVASYDRRGLGVLPLPWPA